MIDFKDFCTWVVVGCGSISLAAFAVYFVIVVGRMAGQLLNSTRTHEPVGKTCPCGKKEFSSTVARVVATDDGQLTVMNCDHCGKEHLG